MGSPGRCFIVASKSAPLKAASLKGGFCERLRAKSGAGGVVTPMATSADVLVWALTELGCDGDD
jgi:hypothetical protein